MNIYQKAATVKKFCENTPICKRSNKFSNIICPYYDKCKVSELINSPCFESIERLVDVIEKETWSVNVERDCEF